MSTDREDDTQWDDQATTGGMGVDENRSAKQLYEVFRNIRRRYVLYYAKQVSGPVSVDELVGKIASWEDPLNSEGYSRDHRRSIYNSLQQTHLPKLEDVGLIEYNSNKKTVALTAQAERVEFYPASNTAVWGRRYRLLCVFATIAVSIDILALSPFISVQNPIWFRGFYLFFIIVTIKRSYGHYRKKLQFRKDGPDIVIE